VSFFHRLSAPDNEVEEVARRDAGWIRVGIVGAVWHDVDQSRAVMG